MFSLVRAAGARAVARSAARACAAPPLARALAATPGSKGDVVLLYS
jgi:hypothetical protein